MRPRLFPLLVLLVVMLGALLVWAWSTDAVLKAKCSNARGTWNAGERSCMLAVTPARP
ncbi:hypothetical protein Q9Q95_13750 [Sphingomonas sp. DG1-23]|uniref:hypothetical protein n=1 Tax=Sphingomonas sp. DG1-23 TaxID=3068316 RepID=UPI00273F4F13|nr:hypothetical protein [Sphingomonas sp. DG1-23]MDP5279994.1 hypothetical protein [Sphingomonas sp. DG1-23]